MTPDLPTGEFRRESAPIIECFVRKSKDQKYVIFKTVITDIRSVKYYEAVLRSDDGPRPPYQPHATEDQHGFSRVG